MEEIEAKEIIAAVVAASVAAGSYAAYSSNDSAPADLNSITDEVIERTDRGEKVEVTCNKDGDCKVTD